MFLETTTKTKPGIGQNPKGAHRLHLRKDIAYNACPYPGIGMPEF
jgi:hypothetical protein